MDGTQASRATAAALSVVSSLGLPAADAVVLNDSNKLTLRLLPCDTLARVAPVTDQVARFEIELARRLTGAGCPVAALDPRVEARPYERDGFVITLWTYYAPVTPAEPPPGAYAAALTRLHTGMRALDVPAPHFTDRVAQAERLMADHARTPDLADADRALLADTLRTLGAAVREHGGAEQLLHGEPHPGNVLSTDRGVRFIDLETCCRGPVEFDLAHAPDEVAGHYAGADRTLLEQCRTLVLAMITAWRWDRDDRLPGGRALAAEWLERIRRATSDG
ncbi:phosphotransferase enzyme family protein [Streptomyces nigra]|uniref:phosphotransferase enzyme family protein n=1 Tax=Streptomyces nigra TaxID=1827580 RepID=UPI0035DAA926